MDIITLVLFFISSTRAKTSNGNVKKSIVASLPLKIGALK
jgi:hypothetical protein